MGRVAVTGGSGELGGACVVDLVEHGWDVVNLDRVAPERSPAVFVPVDLTDFGQVVEVLSAVDDRYVGIDAVVHLAEQRPGRSSGAPNTLGLASCIASNRVRGTRYAPNENVGGTQDSHFR